MKKHRQKSEDKQKNKTRQIKAPPSSNQVGLVEHAGVSGPVSSNTLQAQATRLGDPHLQSIQRQVLAAQIGRVQGNGHLQRVIASLKPNKTDNIQRDKPQEKTAVAEQAPSTGKPKFDLNQWLHGKIYELLKEQLGEDKLKEHAKTLATKATKALMEQIQGVTSEADFLQKAQAEQIGRLLTADIRKGAEALLKSPEGQKVRQYILDQTQEEPVFAVGMVLLALGAMIAANADIPELKKDFDLGAGFKVSGQAKVGKFRALAIEQVNLGLGYSSKYFQASVQGGYAGEGDKTGFGAQAGASVGTSKLKFATKATLDPDGNLKLDLGPALALESVGLSAGASHSSAGWSGVGQLRLGDKKNALTTQVNVGADGQAKLGYGLKLRNPLDLKNLTLDASFHHTLNDPKITGAKLNSQYDILQDDKTGRYLFLRLEGSYQPGDEAQPRELKGLIILGGRF